MVIDSKISNEQDDSSTRINSQKENLQREMANISKTVEQSN